MKMTFVQYAGLNERFAEGAFDSQIGLSMPVNTPSGRKSGKVLAAEVSDDGASATLTIEVQGLQAPDVPLNLSAGPS